MCIQRCIRQRRAELNYRAMLKEKYRKEAWNAAEAAKEFLLELEIARQLLERQRAGCVRTWSSSLRNEEGLWRSCGSIIIGTRRGGWRSAGSYSNHA